MAGRPDGAGLSGLQVWTIGHSTLALEVFIARLATHRIEAVADVRRFPGSRTHPQFGAPVLDEALAAACIAYRHLPELGGRRRPHPDSPNTRWRNPAFRAYADHMQSQEFAAGMGQLLALAADRRTAILCAEGLWWRCHRGLIADYLKAGGAQVWHILPTGQAVPHPYTSAAAIVRGRLSYAAAPDAGLTPGGDP